MNKKTILILGSIVIVIMLCCCLILAGLMMYTFMNEDEAAVLVDGEPIELVVATVTPFAAKPTSEIIENNTADYASEVGTQLVSCSEQIGNFTDIAVRLNENVNLIMDADYIAEVNYSVDQIELYCTDIGKDENVPPAYIDINEELLLADTAMSDFVENMHKGIDNIDIDAISQALHDLASASSHYDKASTLLKE
ncbi:MAG: hypothetical protein JEZ00_06665 [Anaerolineaceae bacterium]|nr:hypothetical protein [Anaerolineaceae bacterium]